MHLLHRNQLNIKTNNNNTKCFYFLHKCNKSCFGCFFLTVYLNQTTRHKINDLLLLCFLKNLTNTKFARERSYKDSHLFRRDAVQLRMEAGLMRVDCLLEKKKKICTSTRPPPSWSIESEDIIKKGIVGLCTKWVKKNKKKGTTRGARRPWSNLIKLRRLSPSRPLPSKDGLKSL